MLDIKFLRENPDIVKQNIKNKFQDFKLPMVDEVIELDTERRRLIAEVEDLRGSRNKYSKQIGALMAQGKKEEAEEMKNKVTENSQKLTEDDDCCDGDCDCCDDDDCYEVECPNCGETICIDGSIVEEGEMECRNCGEHLEFDYDEEDEEGDEE